MNARICRRIAVLALLACPTSPVWAQRGDHGNEKQPETWRKFTLPDPSPRTPAEALASFKVAPGFRIELVAAEPLVEDPIAVAWDADGRLWAVEMRGYMMPDVDAKEENKPVGSIAVLEDTDGDGKMDKRTTFLDGLVMPRAIAMVKGGVLVAEPPTLWYCRDTDGDLKCDVKVEAYKGYARQGPVEHTDNGLLHNIDNWMYNAKSSVRLRFDLNADGSPELTVEGTNFRGQWGITADNFGRLYHNSNSNYLQADVLGAEYFHRNANLPGGASTAGGIASDQNVYGIRPNPGVNRGYQASTLDERGRLRRTTATCGPGIYRGNQFPPELVGDAFIPEPGGNVVTHFAIEEKDGSVKAKHVSYDDPEWGKREFIASTDERFRPVNCYTGPDGCLYVVDLYRGILQHKLYVTTFLRKQIIERKLWTPLGMGRIYRVVHEGTPPEVPPKLSHATSAELVTRLSHPNGWVRDTAQRLLVERGDTSVAPALAELATSGSDPLGRLHALWTLAGIGRLDYETLEQAVQDSHVKVACVAIHVSEPMLDRKPADEFERQEQDDLLHRVFDLGKDPRPQVRLQVALSLSGVKAPLVGAALRQVLLDNAANNSIRTAVLSGLYGRELEFLQRLLADPAWQSDGKGRADVLHDLSACVANERNPGRVAFLFDYIADQKPATRWRQLAMLDGLADTATVKGKPHRPLRYEEQPLGLAKLQKSSDAGVAKELARLNEFIKWGAAAAPPPPPPPLTPVEQARFDQGKQLFLMTCASCHQPTGLGEEGKAPPLLDSPFLLGTPRRLVRIVLNGVHGPINVHGRVYEMEMPPLKGFTDEQIAAILTYARREWEHAGSPIDPTTVTGIRKEVGERDEAWTEKELLKIAE
jgi:mono/diheme cytochrome c family protein/glucose/arabinose dehydrogenase